MGSIPCSGFAADWYLELIRDAQVVGDANLPIITTNNVQKNPLRILLLGSNDIRNIFKTIARAWRHGKRRIEFYVMETQSSTLARHMVLLSILFDQELNVSLQDRAELFLEVYGNLQIREKTETWIKQQSTNLIRVVTDKSGFLSDLIDFTQLKFRERDDIEFVLKFWRDDSRKFDATKLWLN